MQNQHSTSFDEHEVLHELKHFLPAQAPLKDFVHHNTLHAFQHLKFDEALKRASAIFGYKTSLQLSEYRSLYSSGRIRKDILLKAIEDKKGKDASAEWTEKLLWKNYDISVSPRVGKLRAYWKEEYHIDMDALTHPILYRTLGSYLDQGIAIWNFPVHQKGFLASVRELEQNSFTSFFSTSRAKKLLLEEKTTITELLHLITGDETLYKTYLYDQQFAHQGWSGMVSAIEDLPSTLLDRREISLHDIIIFELLLEINALDAKFGKTWAPLNVRVKNTANDLFSEVETTELHEVISLWQDAFEWSYYDEVLEGIKEDKPKEKTDRKSFQAMFCIDDRECSFRRYIEQMDNHCETFGTPGFFSIEFFFQPEDGKFYTKLCPAPVTPKYLIKEVGSSLKRKKEVHFNEKSHSLLQGWFISQTIGFWAAVKLFVNIFKPSMSPATAYSFRHMDQNSELTIENKNVEDIENGLQIGFTIEEMTTRAEGLLKSIGLVKDFAPIVYIIGHGASSVNNPHFAAYDCGACCGRPGSVNARVMSFMLNHAKVREALAKKGTVIPASTQFIGGLHDTTRDEIAFYDVDTLFAENAAQHAKNHSNFLKALDLNAKERSRRFESIDSHNSAEKIHEQILIRSVSLFEPRPELNHATNALCIVGRRELTEGLFLDRRSFMNSFDYKVDPDGTYLFNILKAAAPVCGGINLEYFFSRVDNQKLGAGTKLPHNVMGLFGVANGIDGDLRPGLPSQMIEVHEPIRLMIIAEHFNDVVLKTIQKAPETYEWFINEWVHLVTVNPETREFSVFKNGNFTPYKPLKNKIEKVNLSAVLEDHTENLPVFLIN
ncbi:MAG: YbcC family protein [Flavobacteriales bacterium]